MAEIRGKTEELLQGISFQVEWDGNTIGFAECGGLSESSEVADYREGTDPSLYMRKIPGLVTTENLVLKRGITQDNTCLVFRENMKILGPKAPVQFRKDVQIHVLNRQLQIKRSFVAVRAWPVKWDLTDLVAGSSDILIETLELVHEGLYPVLAGSGASVATLIGRAGP